MKEMIERAIEVLEDVLSCMHGATISEKAQECQPMVTRLQFRKLDSSDYMRMERQVRAANDRITVLECDNSTLRAKVEILRSRLRSLEGDRDPLMPSYEYLMETNRHLRKCNEEQAAELDRRGKLLQGIEDTIRKERLKP